MKMKRYALVLAMCAIITGCAQKPTSPQPEPTQVVAPEPLPQEAQSALEQLNAKCASELWRNEIDIIECPETRPENRVISGDSHWNTESTKCGDEA